MNVPAAAGAAIFIAATASAGTERRGPELLRELLSPDGRLRLSLHVPPTGSSRPPVWSLSFRGRVVLSDCRLGLETQEAGDLLIGARIVRESRRSENRRPRILFGKARFGRDRYNELRLALERPGGLRVNLFLRLFEDAVAFRYEIPRRPGLARIAITDERTSFGIQGNPLAYAQYLENYRTSHEHNVTVSPFADISPEKLLDMPLPLIWEDGVCAAITEASLRRYAGMSLMRVKGAPELACHLTPREDGVKVRRELPLETPWRVVLVADRPGALLESTTLYCLNPAPVIGDSSWIKPGKITWPWWNGNLFDAEPGAPILSFETAARYIDFCKENGIPFHSVIADESDTPWYVQPSSGVTPVPGTDATKVRANLNLYDIRRYAVSRGVRLWTWAHQAALRGRVEEAFAAYERIGWSGIMVDFFDHDDQESVEHAEAILQAAARHKILVHFHGVWKPTGMERTYPNLMNHEGALNLEYLKWSDRCTPEHNLRMAFTRLIAGPMDYHLGGFRAVSRERFQPRWRAPNVLGTRCHQLALYVCFDNPTPMVADYPAAYAGQPGFEFIRLVPTWWDETRVLKAEAGELLVTARRSGKARWYLGGLSGAREHEVVLPLSFLGPGRYTARIWRDGPETRLDPNRLTEESRQVAAADSLRIRIAPGGGFVAHFAPAPRR